jgi:acyl-CoA thioesterase FadM
VGDANEYRWVVDLVAPAVDTNHVRHPLILGMFADAVQGYYLDGLGLAFDVVYPAGAMPVFRELTLALAAEIFSGDRLRCGTRTVSRGRRSFVLEQAMWRDGEPPAATCRSVVVTVGPGGAVAVPDAVATAMDRFEGVALGS